jgi:tetratricopeptide (TPR) repeat protein
MRKLIMPAAFIWGVLLIMSYAFSQQSADLLREGDLLWQARAEEGKALASIAAYKRVLEIDGDNYDACWKIARSYFFIGDGLPETDEMKERHREMGEQGMPYGKKALAVNPGGIEGHYYYALCIAEYSIGISIVKALAKGLGPEYEKHVGKALEINRCFDGAGPLRAMGRYWYKLPWPKRDIEKSIRYLKEAAEAAPFSIRGRVYLAESYLKENDKGLAQAELRKALEIQPDVTREVDAVRWQKRAGELLKENF